MKNKYIQNFKKTMEIIDLCYTLKAAYIKKTNPGLSNKEVEHEIYKGIIRRKEEAWKYHGN
ncbi:hypothetical protein ACFL6D_05040 [Spirochaetota bacterium]